jgi:hypothetical protein
MAKRTVAPADARRIRDNLLAVVRRHYRSQADFERNWEFGHGTVRAWFHRTRPTPPSLVNLLDLTREPRQEPRHRLSLDWLLLGSGDPEYRRFQRLAVRPSLSALLANVSDAWLARAGLVRQEEVDRLVQQVAKAALQRRTKRSSKKKPRRPRGRKRSPRRRTT